MGRIRLQAPGGRNETHGATRSDERRRFMRKPTAASAGSAECGAHRPCRFRTGAARTRGWRSGDLEIGRRHLSVATPLDLVGELLALLERCQSRTLDGGDVHEHIL